MKFISFAKIEEYTNVWVQLIIQYNFAEEVCYCEKHIKNYDCSNDQMIMVKRIIIDFKIKLEKMESYFIYIQERYNYFEDPNTDFNLNSKNERILKEMKESLDTKIRRSIKFIT